MDIELLNMVKTKRCICDVCVVYRTLILILSLCRLFAWQRAAARIVRYSNIVQTSSITTIFTATRQHTLFSCVYTLWCDAFGMDEVRRFGGHATQDKYRVEVVKANNRINYPRNFYGIFWPPY